MKRFLTFFALSLAIFCTEKAVAQMCAPAQQREKITPTTNFYDFNGSAPDGNIFVANITAATPTTGTNQALGWTGANLTAGGNTPYIWAASTSTVFGANLNGVNTIQTLTRPLTDANLAGNGAVVTIELTGGNGDAGGAPM